jgi:hypothetical protein
MLILELAEFFPVIWRSEIQLDRGCERGESRTSYRGRVARRQQTLSKSVHGTDTIVVASPKLDNPTMGFERASRGSPG